MFTRLEANRLDKGFGESLCYCMVVGEMPIQFARDSIYNLFGGYYQFFALESYLLPYPTFFTTLEWLDRPKLGRSSLLQV